MCNGAVSTVRFYSGQFGEVQIMISNYFSNRVNIFTRNELKHAMTLSGGTAGRKTLWTAVIIGKKKPEPPGAIIRVKAALFIEIMFAISRQGAESLLVIQLTTKLTF